MPEREGDGESDEDDEFLQATKRGLSQHTMGTLTGGGGGVLSS